MKLKTISLLSIIAAILCTTSLARDLQVTIPNDGRIVVPEKLPPFDPTMAFSYHPRLSNALSDAQLEKIVGASGRPLSGLPLWTYSVTAAQNGKHYSGSMVGTSPYAVIKTATSVPTMVIAVRFSFLDRFGRVAFIFDPFAADPCAGGRSTYNLVNSSPILNTSPGPYVMNAVNVGTTQYVDAFQRANFWKLVSGTNYHVTLSSTPNPALSVNVTIPFGHWGVGIGTCSVVGAMDVNEWDSLVQTQILALVGATPDRFPLFYTQNVAFTINGQCCALGYHGAILSTGQTYSASEFESSGYFPHAFADTVVLSHEVAEWMDDPLGNNPTPPWGHIGQVSGCQGNLEVGDPKTPTNFNSNGVFMNGFTYHLQELAFYSWFYGGASTGSGGKYSNNQDPTQSFQVPSTLCF